MIITEPQIRRIMPHSKAENISAFVKAFNGYSEQFGITTKQRLCHFIAQLAHESAELCHLEENLNYSAEGLVRTWPSRFTAEKAKEYARQPEKIANCVYANRMGNGDEASGDGWRYRGRGLIMLTGKTQYLSYENSGLCNGKLTSHPEWLAKYPGALKSAMWFWKSNGLNEIADRDDGGTAGEGVCKTISKRVNGGTNGLSQRLYYYRVAKKVFGL